MINIRFINCLLETKIMDKTLSINDLLEHKTQKIPPNSYFTDACLVSVI